MSPTDSFNTSVANRLFQHVSTAHYLTAVVEVQGATAGPRGASMMERFRNLDSALASILQNAPRPPVRNGAELLVAMSCVPLG